MKFVAPEQAPEQAEIIRNTPFWPDVDLSEFRSVMRTDGTVTQPRLKQVALGHQPGAGCAALHSGAYLMKVRAHQYDTVDALCWRHYGRTQGVTEQVLKANPGLAEYGPFLPHGLQVELPDIPTTTTVQTVQLWD